jgi:hypothetical protein
VKIKNCNGIWYGGEYFKEHLKYKNTYERRKNKLTYKDLCTSSSEM